MSSGSKKHHSETSSEADAQKSPSQDSLEKSSGSEQVLAGGTTQTSSDADSEERSFEDGSTQRSVGSVPTATRKNFSSSQTTQTQPVGSVEVSNREKAKSFSSSFSDLESTDSLEDVWSEVPLGSTGSSASTRISEQRQERTVLSGPVHEDNSPDGDPSDLKPGSKFGQFTIIRYVGGGGMGRVYEGEDRNLERKVAIKVLPQKRAREDGVAARFLNEAKSAARLNHENIAQVYLYGNENGVPYIAFEYVEGVNLRDYVRECGALELGEAVDYVLQTAAALSHAAAHGVTHRDVKPSNIIVTPQKRVKLIDMGLARLLKPQLDDDLTESGVTLGTFDYISPEQARDPRLADVRSDVYSLGCTFYYMLASTPPFPEGTMLQKLLQHQADEAPDIREVNPSVPLEVAAIVKKMMKKNPDERYQTPDALIADLLEVADMIGLRVSSRGYAESSSQEKSSERLSAWRLPGVCAAALFVVLVGGYAFFSDNRDLSLPEITPPRPIESPFASTDVSEQTESEPRIASGADENDVGTNSSDVSSPESSYGVSDASKISSEVELGALELNELYAQNSARYSEVFLSGSIDDGLEWRNSYLTSGFSAFESDDYAFGWRSRSVSAESDSLSVFENSLTTNPAETFACSFSVYPLLGSGSSSSSSPFATPVVRIVDGVGKEPNTFASLQSALASVSPRETGTASGDARLNVRIELKFNNTLSSPSLTIDRQNVEICAAKECTPKLRFVPPETPNGSGGESMFLLKEADVAIRGVSIEFTVPSLDAVSSEEWTVFEDVGASTVSVSDSVLTVCNMSGEVYSSPLHSNVAFFRAHSETSYDQLEGLSVDAPFTVRLDRVLARGEATLFVSERQGARLDAKNSGFNLAGAVMHYVERRQSRVSAAPPAKSSDELQSSELAAPDSNVGNGELQTASPCFSLNFEQTVVVGRTCLVRVDAEEAETSPPFRASITNSIVRLNDQAFALVLCPVDFDASSFGDQWKLDGVLALDAPCFCRWRADRSSFYQDCPFPTDAKSCELAKLSDLTPDYTRLDVIAPHRFALSNFTNYILVPTSASMTVSSDAKAHAETIKSGFFDVLVKYD